MRTPRATIEPVTGLPVTDVRRRPGFELPIRLPLTACVHRAPQGEQKQTFELNRLSWDERVEAHWASDMYRRHAADLRGGRPCLAEHIVRDVGNVAAKALARITPPRPAPAPIDRARARGKNRRTPIRFQHAGAAEAPEAMLRTQRGFRDERVKRPGRNECPIRSSYDPWYRG